MKAAEERRGEAVITLRAFQFSEMMDDMNNQKMNV